MEAEIHEADSQVATNADFESYRLGTDLIIDINKLLLRSTYLPSGESRTVIKNFANDSCLGTKEAEQAYRNIPITMGRTKTKYSSNTTLQVLVDGKVMVLDSHEHIPAFNAFFQEKVANASRVTNRDIASDYVKFKNLHMLLRMLYGMVYSYNHTAIIENYSEEDYTTLITQTRKYSNTKFEKMDKEFRINKMNDETKTFYSGNPHYLNSFFFVRYAHDLCVELLLRDCIGIIISTRQVPESQFDPPPTFPITCAFLPLIDLPVTNTITYTPSSLTPPVDKYIPPHRRAGGKHTKRTNLKSRRVRSSKKTKIKSLRGKHIRRTQKKLY